MITVVLDFPANTESQRLWLRNISDEVHSEHTCYFVDRKDEVCIKQLLKRGNPNTDTVEMFHTITQYFVEPSNSENINTFLKHFLEELMELIDLQQRDELLNYLNNSVEWRRALSDKFGERPLS